MSRTMIWDYFFTGMNMFCLFTCYSVNSQNSAYSSRDDFEKG